MDFCGRWRYHPQHPSVSEVLEFLRSLYDKGLGYSAINSHRSALSSILQVPGIDKIGEHVLVCRFMKGIYNLRPPQTRYTKMWDMNKVLGYLKNLGQNKDLTIKQISLKTAMLLAILAGRRLHTLHQLDKTHMDICDVSRKVVCQIPGLIKTSKPSKPNKPIVYRAYTKDLLLCPVACIKEYMKVRATLVGNSTTEFFISHGKPHHPISKDTLARWVKDVMREAGIDVSVFKPHSTRAASTSKAYALGVPLSDILKQGQWSNAKTFFTFYCREIEDDDGSEDL